MKKYLVIGNPIEHSLSPKLHNYWIKKNKIEAIYDKKKINIDGIEEIINQLKNNKISGLNVTVPFKNTAIPFLDGLSEVAKKTRSVNTIFKKEGKIIGDNTDVFGFRAAIEKTGINLIEKKVLILGAGGVVPSIISALQNKKISKIIVTNRTKKKAENLKKMFSNIEIMDWGKQTEFDIVINATSLGLKKDDKINFNFDGLEGKFFYDVIYNPKETNFLMNAKKNNMVENGRYMFVYQAAAAFRLWHGIEPQIDQETMNLLDYD